MSALPGAGGDFRLLTGTEVDILQDRLDFDDELLAELDVVVASLHVPTAARRRIRSVWSGAAENQFVHILGHLTGRLLLGARTLSSQCAGGD